MNVNRSNRKHNYQTCHAFFLFCEGAVNGTEIIIYLKKSSFWIDSNHISKLTYKDAVSGYAECKEDKISVRCVRRALTGLGLWVRDSLGSDLQKEEAMWKTGGKAGFS